MTVAKIKGFSELDLILGVRVSVRAYEDGHSIIQIGARDYSFDAEGNRTGAGMSLLYDFAADQAEIARILKIEPEAPERIEESNRRTREMEAQMQKPTDDEMREALKEQFKMMTGKDW